jgi:pyridoxamine 5'-phosphate oxidase
MTNLNNLGKEFDAPELRISDCAQDPIKQFESWFEVANKHQLEANGMTLSTISENNTPKARIVLLKYVDIHGFVFFTNYNSQKGQDINYNPHATLNFWWQSCQRQVRVSGIISKLDSKHSDEYFHSRPRSSQIAAIISKQSSPIKSSDKLKREFESFQESNSDKTQLTRPNYWGGYILKHSELEFWQGRPCRLHDRILYTKSENKWLITRLCP